MADRIEADLEGLRVPLIGYEDLVRNKEATGRERDLADIKRLRGER